MRRLKREKKMVPGSGTITRDKLLDLVEPKWDELS